MSTELNGAVLRPGKSCADDIDIERNCSGAHVLIQDGSAVAPVFDGNPAHDLMCAYA